MEEKWLKKLNQKESFRVRTTTWDCPLCHEHGIQDSQMHECVKLKDWSWINAAQREVSKDILINGQGIRI